MDEFLTVFIFTEKANLIWQGSEGIAFGLLVLIASSIWAIYASWFILFKKNFKRITHVMLSAILMYSGIGWVKLGYEEMQRHRNNYSRLQKMYALQDYEVVEGTVHVIKVGGRYPNGPVDIIQIGDVRFSIGCGSSRFDYSQSISCGGALIEGVYARVFYYYEDVTYYSTPIQYPDILRVDIKK